MIIIKKMVRFFLKLLDKIAVRKVLVLGDSHAQVFMHPLFKVIFPFTMFDVCSVGGATVSGLQNPNSKTQAINIFNEKLKSTGHFDVIICMLREVDTGFVIWYRAEKYGTKDDEMYKKAVDNYFLLLKKLRELAPVIVISTPLPTITDDNDWGEIANLRKEVKATQFSRTQLTLRFNNDVESFCDKNKIYFINLDEVSIGLNGLVRKKLLNKDSNNHHYDKIEHIKLIAPRLKKILKWKSR